MVEVESVDEAKVEIRRVRSEDGLEGQLMKAREAKVSINNMFITVSVSRLTR